MTPSKLPFKLSKPTATCSGILRLMDLTFARISTFTVSSSRPTSVSAGRAAGGPPHFDRDGLYRALSTEGQAHLCRIFKVTNALGLRFEFHLAAS